MSKTTARARCSEKHEVWRLEPHICRSCFSRIVSAEADDEGRREYRCSNCDLSAVSRRVASLCACGMTIRKGGRGAQDLGLRCHENRARSPEFPALYVASYSGAQEEA